ncbi:MAG TPA: DUF805 domain-containing protein [Pyrinomonadaceae bacterium]|nr:DUF805 domain-containing protein [Pyrinomonadaceae bacterium]
MSIDPPHVFTFGGRISRAPYFLIGTLLFAAKHNIDRLIATSFGFEWSLFNYWIFDEGGLTNIKGLQRSFLTVLLLVALPFVFIGVALTLRRLRDANLPSWLVLLFFVPFLNLLFFLLLSVVPSAAFSLKAPKGFRKTLERIIPESELGSAIAGIVATTVLSLAFAVLATYGLAEYGWGIFVGLPFFLGLNSVLVYGFHRPRPIGRCLAVSALAVSFAGLALFMLAVEGLVCLIMAAPLAFPLSLFGGFIGFVLQQRDTFAAQSVHVMALTVFLTPSFITAEHAQGPKSPLYEVKTSVVIEATPEIVWKNVTNFAELPVPKDLLFRTGIAYPLRAEIQGSGVSAVRHCVFSTGAFVEPITIWDAPHRLAFDVSAQPPVMEEWSPYTKLSPPHLDHYLVSRRGEFRLTPLAQGQTLLEGTTWYENRFWPGKYWQLWSDFIIHRIHSRVLIHIKALSESAAPHPLSDLPS